MNSRCNICGSPVHLNNSRRFACTRDESHVSMAFGGPGSGRYPAGSGKEKDKENHTRESNHPTHPLPDSPNDGAAVYDYPDQEHGTGTMQVTKQHDGSYHGDAGHYDTMAKSATEMRSHLMSIKAKSVGWEHK